MQLSLDLTATVTAFPLARRRALVCEVARTIMRESDEEGVRYWKATIRFITDPLLAAGVPFEQVQAEARRFSDAVQQEMWRGGDHMGGAG